MMYQSSALSENEFYEHLTELIRLFKLLFAAVDEAVSLMLADEDYEHSVRHIRRILRQEGKAGEAYDTPLEHHRHLQSAYQRFVCRLAENLAPIKTKSSKEEEKILLADQYVLRVENCINFHKKQRNISKLFRKIFGLTQRFCEGCDMLLSCCSQQQAVQALLKEFQQQQPQRSSQNRSTPRPSPHTTQSQSNFHKIMVVFNKRFATISCLDLDYNTYKSYCYMSRNDTDQELYKDFVNRNGNVSRAILRYSKHFTDFLRKKEKTIIRKNRFRELKDVNKTNQHLQSEHEQIAPKISYEQIKKTHTVEPRTEESPLPVLPALKQDKKRLLEPQECKREETSRGIRGNYHLKNIYLTINKGHDKFEAQNSSNRFMLNYSLPKPSNDFTKRTSSLLKPGGNSLKSTQIINQIYSPSILMHYDKPQPFDSYVFDQMLSQTRRGSSPRTTIIHRCHKEKKVDRRNIRITNLTFRGQNYSKLPSVLDPENIVS